MILVSKLKKVLKKKTVFSLTLLTLTVMFMSESKAFTCRTKNGNTVRGSSVYVDFSPRVEVGQNLVVDFRSEISCWNDYPIFLTDYVSVINGSQFGPSLNKFSGSIDYNGTSYSFPVERKTDRVIFKSMTPKPWPLRLYLTPIGAPSDGIAIRRGDLIAILRMEQTNNEGALGVLTWNIYANNNVVIPTGGCDVSSRNVTVTLPDYPGTAAVPLTVHCGKNQQLAYYLTGTTVDTASTIFTNTSSSNPATGVGVQLSNRNGIVATNKNVSLGTVGTSPVNLGLTASYARTTGQVVAGNVQSIIGVTFVYQ